MMDNEAQQLQVVAGLFKLFAEVREGTKGPQKKF